MAHPSTRTNNNNLKGSETNIGDNIIIPKDMRMDAITISITKKGKNNKNPIWKAVFIERGSTGNQAKTWIEPKTIHSKEFWELYQSHAEQWCKSVAEHQ